ncbi:glycerophosphodiester phosphodiesterase [Cytobacillus purgationiresistens]|uniref:Glycerophosphoryl diester phosphodiesterase n=1 Tax=Cytobacillus purgationiresistens TaxID=863449 RepID=A0ABU0ANJ7_9BACI|nr:glycerophosphodiester phosphodiesterase family protein [Cytobacillus purgationiresistens]MDQ0272770.1 glycerophosphoryl diester phosphodiesterase [Cytobacillus purgationiresistens]
MKKAMLVGSALAMTLIFTPFQEGFAKGPDDGHSKKIANIAHRGASGYAPENTIAAFDKAFQMKADYIEIDVQRSKDGELVVIHDTTVDRTTDGTGNVKDLSFAEMNQLDAGSWMGEQFSGEKIPTFDEVLDRYRGKIGILIELKSPELYPGIEEQVTQKLKKRNMDKPKNEKIIVQSFNFESMKKIDKMLPRVPIGVLTSNAKDTSEAALKEFSKYADYFNPSYGLVNKELVDLVHMNGMKIQSWTVRTPEAAQFLLEMKVDGIITDYPDYVKPKK